MYLLCPVRIFVGDGGFQNRIYVNDNGVAPEFEMALALYFTNIYNGV